MKLNYFQLISLAGLLHDVGKLKQRAELKVKNEFNWIYCPEDEHHKSKYVHAAHTADFLDWFIDRFNIETQEQENNLVNIASYHHKRDDGGALEEIVKKSDRLSSGFEREESDKSGKYKEDRLESIFSQVWLNKKPKTYYYPIKKLSFDVLPEEESSSNNVEEYKKLYEDFEKDLKKIKKNQKFDIFWDAVEHIYEKYTWSIPSSSFYSYPRISLFDHSKTTAAIAQALYGFHKSGNTLSVEKIRSIKENEFLLVQGDFAGIQNFIFSRMGESNKFAAKILRAKSFFVSLATDLVAYEICRKLGLTKAAIVMNAGGKFTLILPNTPKTIETIHKVEKDINREFMDLTFGETRFYLAFISLSSNDFLGGKFAEKMSNVVGELEKRKLKPDIERFVFDNYLEDVKSKGGVCDICGKYPADYDEKEKVRICQHCRKFKEVGESLVKSRYFVISDDGKHNVFGSFKISFSNSREFRDAFLVFDLDKTADFEGVAKSKITGYVPKVLEEEIKIGKYDALNEDEKSDINDVKTFAMISEDAKETNQEGEFVGESFLGILKADVDNLGRIFIEGIKSDISISKVASLSRMIDFFFTGWLQHKIKNDFPSVYTVFSGGDDLFLIGPFNRIIELALEINKHLREYTQNKDIHLSCGIYFVKPKVPVYQMADGAEENLEKAKGAGRNRISIFGRVVEWNRFEAMMENKKIKELLDGDVLTNVQKYTLFDIADKAERASEEGGSVRDLMWKPLLVYDLYRNIKGKDREEKAEIISDFVKFIEEYKGDFVVPLSYYIYTTRRKRDAKQR